MPINEKKKDSLLFAILDVINVLINFSFLKLCSALVTVTTHFVNSRSKASEHLQVLLLNQKFNGIEGRLPNELVSF